MAARSGMSDIITTIRAWCEASTAEYTIDATTYFDDDQLQAILDRQRREIRREVLTSRAELIGGGTYERHDHFFEKYPYVERATSGSAVWRVTDANGDEISTADYSIDYDAGKIRFTTDTSGSARYLDYAHYDVYRAAAEIWRQKAANVASRFDVKTDNHDLKRSQLEKAYSKKAREFMRMAPARSVRMVRGDTC